MSAPQWQPKRALLLGDPPARPLLADVSFRFHIGRGCGDERGEEVVPLGRFNNSGLRALSGLLEGVAAGKPGMVADVARD